MFLLNLLVWTGKLYVKLRFDYPKVLAHRFAFSATAIFTAGVTEWLEHTPQTPILAAQMENRKHRDVNYSQFRAGRAHPRQAAPSGPNQNELAPLERPVRYQSFGMRADACIRQS